MFLIWKTLNKPGELYGVLLVLFQHGRMETLQNWEAADQVRSSLYNCLGSRCWMNGGLNGEYPNLENSFLSSPSFNFTSLAPSTTWVISFWANHKIERNYDGFR